MLPPEHRESPRFSHGEDVKGTIRPMPLPDTCLRIDELVRITSPERVAAALEGR